MRRTYFVMFGLIVTLFAIGFGLTRSAHSQNSDRILDLTNLSMADQLAAEAQVNKDDAKAMLKALSPVIQQRLAKGQTVTLGGLGTFRVVKIPAHRELRGGRPITVPARNYVEFLPQVALVNSSNAITAQPAAVVQPFQYNPLRGRAEVPQISRVRVPSTRVP